MPKLVNKRAHGVRVRYEDDNGNEKRVRVRPGQVVEVDGKGADALNGVDGIESASSDDEKAWDSYLAQGRLDPASKFEAIDGAAALAATHLGMVTVAAPLNTVVGDDDAPYGPPTGTITTKQAVMRESLENKKAYGDHERVGEEEDNEKLSDVEREQARTSRVLEDLHNEMLKDDNEESDSSGEDDKSEAPSRSRRKATSEE